MKHLKQFLTIFLMVGVMLSTGLTAAVDNPRVIDGEPLRITVYDDSTMHVEFNRERCGGDQYNENSKGSILLFYGDKLRGWGGGYNTFQLYNDVEPVQFMPLSNTLVDPFTISTVYNAGMTGDVQVTQTVSYTNGDIFYKIEWVVTNNGVETYTDLRFRHGGDTSFMGGEPSIGNWGPGLGMVYLTNDGSDGLMGLYGALGHYGETPSPADNHAEYFPANVESYMKSRFYLNGFIRDVNHDAAYALEWLRASLAPGESWTVTAFERFDDCDGPPRQGLVVTGVDNGGECGETITVRFYVENFRTAADTYDLSVTSQNGWAVNLLGNNPITIGAADFAVVDVELAIPYPSNSPDVVTLTATSQTNAAITDSDGADIFVTCSGGTCTAGDKALIVYPNGGETFELNQEITIVWTDENVPDPKDGRVRISLWTYENGAYTKVGRIADNLPVTDEAVVWTIDQVYDSTTNSMIDVVPGNNYVVKVREKDRGCHDYSDAVFTINPDPNTNDCVEGDKAVIVSPNGGETFELGDDVTIVWDNQAPPLGVVRLSLWTYENGVYTKVGRIAENIDAAVEAYLWTIDQVYDSTTNTMIEVTPGNTYVVKIREKDRGCHDYSDAVFTINPGTNPNACVEGEKALVAYPNGGETLLLGDDVTITWTNQTTPLGMVRLSLWRMDQGGGYTKIGQIADNIDAALESYDWTINQVYLSETNSMINVEPGASYVIKIREKDRGCHDYSDAVFTIADVLPQ